MEPTILPLKPTYAKDNGLLSLDIDQIALPHGFHAKEKSLIYLPPIVPSYLPHAVINTSSNTIGMLLEFANEFQNNVQQVDVLSH